MGVLALDLFKHRFIATPANPRNAGSMNRPITLYYAATVLFLLLDFLVVTDEMIETGAGFVTTEEIFNYMIVGGIAYLAYIRSFKSLKESKNHKQEE